MFWFILDVCPADRNSGNLFLIHLVMKITPATDKPSVWWLQMFYYMFCNVVLIFGITIFTSAVNVLFKDMGQIVIVSAD